MITEAECVINSRPLCYLYSDRIDDVITPFHLLHGRRLSKEKKNELVEDETKETLNKRLTHLENLMNHIRIRWSHEYLTELREHHSYNKIEPPKQV